jgi:hypothetical protein
MPARPRMRRARRIRQRRWDQISFLDDAGAAKVDHASRAVDDVLGIADHAADSASCHDALDRLYGYLAQQAMQRGRKPVPKRSDSQQR